MNNVMFKNIYPKQVWSNENYHQTVTGPIPGNDERFGFLFPFIAGAAISAPLWYAAGNNKAQQCPPYCPQPIEYQYQIQQPVQYYPYPYPVYPNYPPYYNQPNKPMPPQPTPYPNTKY